MVALSPGLMVVGLTEQEIVGGSNSFTVKVAVDCVATCQGLAPSLPGLPSLASHLTVCCPGVRSAVFTVAVALLLAPVMPSPEMLTTTPSLGCCEPTVAVTVTGSPGNTEVGLAEQATVNCGGGLVTQVEYNAAEESGTILIVAAKVVVEPGIEVAGLNGPDGETRTDSYIEPSAKVHGERIAGRRRAKLSKAQVAVCLAIDVTMRAAKKSLPIRSEDSTALAELGTKHVGEEVAFHTGGCRRQE